MELLSLENMNYADLCSLHNDFFKDYELSLNTTPENHYLGLVRRNVDLKMSLGAFENGKCIGYILVGIAKIDGKLCAYDAETAVALEKRGQGVGTLMLKELILNLRSSRVEFFWLEVLKSNHTAISFYEKEGFVKTRSLKCYQGKLSEIIQSTPYPSNTYFQNLDSTDHEMFPEFWTSTPSWQNSLLSIDSLEESHVLLGIFDDISKALYGYVCARPRTRGIEIIQLAVASEFRMQGYGTALLKKACSGFHADVPVSWTNVDAADSGLITFIERKASLPLFAEQYEMVLSLE